MAKIIFFFFLFFPLLAQGAEVTLNDQPTYAVPSGTTRLLILDLSLPQKLNLIKILNLGTAQQWDISAVYIFEDGSSAGWDGDEAEIARRTVSPFWDTEIPAFSSNRRIFVTVSIASGVSSGRTIKPKAVINSDKTVTGFERTILAGTSFPSVPVSPLAQKGEALSTSTIRWYFTDSSNNEYGFKILDGNLKTVASGRENITYLDEAGLEPNIEYYNRKIVAHNDRGQSDISSISVFLPVKTLPLSIATTTEDTVTEATTTAAATTEEEVAAEEKPLSDQIREIQLKIIDLLGQLIEILKQQISAAQASLFRVISWFLQPFFGE